MGLVAVGLLAAGGSGVCPRIKWLITPFAVFIFCFYLIHTLFFLLSLYCFGLSGGAPEAGGPACDSSLHNTKT